MKNVGLFHWTGQFYTEHISRKYFNAHNPGLFSIYCKLNKAIVSSSSKVKCFNLFCAPRLILTQLLRLRRAVGSILQRSDNQLALSAHVYAEKPRQQNWLWGWHTVDKPINWAHIFQGTIPCQINDKYNPTYCPVLCVGIDSWCPATVEVFIASLKPLYGWFPKTEMETWPRASRLLFCECFTWKEVFISRAW